MPRTGCRLCRPVSALAWSIAAISVVSGNGVAQSTSQQKTDPAALNCKTVPPVEIAARASLARAARAELPRALPSITTLCWKFAESTGLIHTSRPILDASTMPTFRRLGDATISEWYVVPCVPQWLAWHCDEATRKRTLQLDPTNPIDLNASVHDEALPHLVAVLDELRASVSVTAGAALPDCDRQTTVRKIELRSALTNIIGVAQDTSMHVFRIGILPETNSHVDLVVSYDDPVRLDRLCTEQLIIIDD